MQIALNSKIITINPIKESKKVAKKRNKWIKGEK